MRFSILFIFVAIFQIQANSYSQDVKITLHEKQISILDFFEKVETITPYSFLYRVGDIDLNRRVDVYVDQIPLEQVLSRLFTPEGITYKVLDKQIVFSKKNEPPIEEEVVEQQTILGTVTSQKGEPLFGVTVIVEGTRRGVSTDIDGKYTIVADPGEVLLFNMLGFEKAYHTVTDQQVVNITLKEQASELDEVMVVAYGETSKRFNTGSVAQINAETIEEQPVNNPILALQGAAPGLFITQEAGRPGGNVTVRIRGENSINSSNRPLYVVDGIPYSDEPMNQFGYIGFPTKGHQSPLNSINPADIESISILKDADATAIYGSRGANGVILITTKQNKLSGKGLAVNVNVLTGVKEVGHMMDLLSTSEYLAFRRKAFQNDGIEPTNSNAPDLTLWDQNLDMDWQEYLLGGTANFVNAQAGVTGGNARNSFSLNTSYNREGTIYSGDFSYQRFSIRSRYNYKSQDDRFKLNLQANYSTDDNDSFGGNFASTLVTPPNYNPYNEDGSLNWTITNPIAALNSSFVIKTHTLFADLNLGYDISDFLTAKVLVGYNTNDFDQVRKNPSTSLNPAYANFSWGRPNVEKGTTKRQTINIEPQLTYKNQIGNGVFSALLGGTLMRRTQDNQTITAGNYSSDLFLDNIGAAGTYSILASNTDYRYLSGFLRLNYNWDNKYLFNASVRRDGSSRFGPNNQYGNFAALGAAWIFSEESFLKDQSVFSFGKLRASYGTTGNDGIADYGYYQLWTATSSVNTETSTVLTPSGLANLDYSWEKVIKFDVALELGFLEDQILLNANYYLNSTKDQLVGLPLPSQTGFTTVSANLPAVIRNTGIELSLNTKNMSSDTFSWNTAFNITFQKNKLVSFDDLEASSYANTYEIGSSILSQKGYLASVNPETGAYEIEDLDGDGQITFAGDRTILGDRLPKFYGGLQNDLTYKNWSLGFLFQFVKQEDYNYLNNVYTQVGGRSNFDDSFLDYWQQPGDRVIVPKPTSLAGSSFYNAVSSNLNWDDASYIKLRNVNLSYRLPATWVTQIGMRNARVYFQGQNLLTITSYKGLDPESKSTFAPPLRTLSLGVQANF
ncbi:SusC/RagA family TonB-linked outer membrane protein [Zunongwangia pacifica]|uniref:SusC/RagA family TonB-linked outer membrane protein n=1 Tax=Zunongwangia pacifica TaxID=2911062 RepID=A0A9X1ZXC9_9FLAO|nr:SusC/RagA family TonB-linked outer membrane protein [Zunongwangia pacifica]MCL6220900.1 SusC/RagA family TonB-linked outer membrane protein [Zunongwangia pacifica]